MIYESQMKPMQRAISQFRQLIETHLNEIEEVPFSQLPEEDQKEWLRRDAELHPSGFPYCPLRDAYERLQRRHTDFVVTRTFDRDYYLNVGTVTHTALQTWIGRSRQIVGHWECTVCGHKTSKPRIRPKRCPDCGGNQIGYHELGGVHGANIHWHSDGLWRDKNGDYWVIDYKTSYTNAIRKHREQGPLFPYNNNRIQIETYIILLEAKLNIKIQGWMLIYLARDFPKYSYEVVGEIMTDERRELVEAHVVKSDTLFPKARKATTIAAFEELAEHKLCSSHRYYEEKVHSDYDECPLHKVCFRPEKLRAKIVKEIKLYRSRRDEQQSSDRTTTRRPTSK